MIEHARALAARGFHVFPVKAGAKQPPLIKNFPTLATRDPDQLAAWWGQWPDANVGISTSKFGDDEALLVVDVDNKGGKDGNASILGLELFGMGETYFPGTYEQNTPSGGRHLVYRVPSAVKQSVERIGPGLDIRSRGGYILGAGSRVGSGPYTDGGGRVGPAPDWLVARCAGEPGRKIAGTQPIGVNPRTRSYLERYAPASVSGSGGDLTAYSVACRVRDFGLSETDALALMLECWNPRCSPPWDTAELAVKVGNAYRYANDVVGNAATNTVFAKLAKHAYLIEGDVVLWDTADKNGRAVVRHLSPMGFGRTYAADKIQIGNKVRKLTDEWMESADRPTYQSIVFAPKGDVPPHFYNLWRGFAVAPAATAAHPAVAMWLEHCLKNICQGDAVLNTWLVGWFAHMIQRPWEKPLVSIVLKGGKGVGKNALMGSVGALLGGHFLLSSNRRYLVGNFNGHLENLLLFVLDEAFWSGDKQAEGTLKDLITGATHVIERKGSEPYAVDNLTRIAILGNEDWLVPASHDERRFAVFNVGDGRKQDRDFFQHMAIGMAGGGGAAHLLRYLLDVDLSQVDVNAPPASVGLLEQKHASLAPLGKWWLACLQDGVLHGGEFGDIWPEKVPVERGKTAYRMWMREQNMNVRMPAQMLKELRVFCNGLESKRARVEGGYAWMLPPLEVARAQWVKHIGQVVNWE